MIFSRNGFAVGYDERPEVLGAAATVRDVSMPERASGGGAGPGERPAEAARGAARGPHGTRVRGTRQAEAVASVLDRLPGFCSAQQIHAELRKRGDQVGLTTVYRHLQVLSETGRIDAIRDSTGEILYRRCRSDAHHHHLTCRNCGKSVEVEGRAVEHWAEQVANQAGFTEVGHTVELFGLCPDCGPA
jgi:Fur family transcriptional regulator, ferric uptake regulator